MLMSIQITYAAAADRVQGVLIAIVDSAEWAQSSKDFGSMDWMTGRQEFLRFFDVLESQGCDEWLGIMEWAVIEEMRLRGDALNRDIQSAVSSVVSRMAGHPDIALIE